MATVPLTVPSTGGVALALHDLGGTGPTLLICHATGFCGRAYEPLAALLGPSHHVFAMDFRGHGDSTLPDEGSLAWGGMADDVAAVAAALPPGPIHVVGHSMGGAAAVMAQTRAPGLLASAYLYEPIVLPAGGLPGVAPNPMAAGARRRREVFGSRAEALHRYASRPPLSALRAGALASYVEHGFADRPDGTVRLKCRAETEASVFEATGQITLAAVAGTALAVVVARGGEGESPIAALSPRLVDALPGATLRTYAHLGHFGPLQDPDSVAADVLALTAGA